MNMKIVTTFVNAGAKGAETRHRRMVEVLRHHNFQVMVQTLDTEARPKILPLILRKLGAGFMTGCRSVGAQDAYFAFDPYVFIGGALVARVRGARSLYFCRNDQVYQQREIHRHKGRRGYVPIRLYVLQLGCLILCSQYIVQSDFSRQRLINRFWWFFGIKKEGKICVLNNDLHFPLAQLRNPWDEAVLRVAFISNSAWDKKGFDFIERLVTDPAFLSAKIDFRLVGKGSAFDKIVTSAGLAVSSGKLTHIGYIDGPEPIPRLADVVLVPSVVDHFPNLLIECAALGVPMLLSDIEAHRNIFPEHPAYFPLSTTPAEVVMRLMALHEDPQERFRIARQQQMAIVHLADAWQKPLCRLFGDS
jgi:glycosyltransferase involved in cell wall biosynthesis